MRAVRTYTLRAAVALSMAFCLTAPAVHADDSFVNDPKAAQLYDTLARRHGFSAAELDGVRAALADARFLPNLVRAEQNNKERVDVTPVWDTYRNQFVTAANITNGARFMGQYARELARAETEYGVPAAIITGFLGVETRYGTFTGSSRVLDALATQAFDHPTRGPYFMSELAAFFVMCRDRGLDPYGLKGSYAGAVGAPQFMPSNYNRLAVDFDADGRVDLWSPPDAIGSIGNYLNQYTPPDRPTVHWRRGEPLIVPARLAPGTTLAGVSVNAKRPDTTVGALVAAGVIPAVQLPDSTAVGLVYLRRPGGDEYWIALNNFYAVMSYNPRVYYAMAVTQLADAVQRRAYGLPEAGN